MYKTIVMCKCKMLNYNIRTELTKQHHSHIKPDSNHLHQQVGFKHTLFGTQLPINMISSACFYVCLTHFLKQEI